MEKPQTNRKPLALQSCVEGRDFLFWASALLLCQKLGASGFLPRGNVCLPLFPDFPFAPFGPCRIHSSVWFVCQPGRVDAVIDDILPAHLTFPSPFNDWCVSKTPKCCFQVKPNTVHGHNPNWCEVDFVDPNKNKLMLLLISLVNLKTGIKANRHSWCGTVDALLQVGEQVAISRSYPKMVRWVRLVAIVWLTP